MSFVSNVTTPANSTAQLDKLTISHLGFLAQRRLARGVRLNHAEAVVCFCVLSTGLSFGWN